MKIREPKYRIVMTDHRGTFEHWTDDERYARHSLLRRGSVGDFIDRSDGSVLCTYEDLMQEATTPRDSPFTKPVNGAEVQPPMPQKPWSWWRRFLK